MGNIDNLKEEQNNGNNNGNDNANGTMEGEGVTSTDIETGGGINTHNQATADPGVPNGIPRLEAYNSSSLVPGDNGMGINIAIGKKRTNSNNVDGENDEFGRALPGSIIRSSISDNFVQEGHRQSLSGANGLKQKFDYTNQFETIGENIEQDNNDCNLSPKSSGSSNVGLLDGDDDHDNEDDNYNYNINTMGGDADASNGKEQSMFGKQLEEQVFIENDIVMNDIVEDMETLR